MDVSYIFYSIEDTENTYVVILECVQFPVFAMLLAGVESKHCSCNPAINNSIIATIPCSNYSIIFSLCLHLYKCPVKCSESEITVTLLSIWKHSIDTEFTDEENILCTIQTAVRKQMDSEGHNLECNSFVLKILLFIKKKGNFSIP